MDQHNFSKYLNNKLVLSFRFYEEAAQVAFEQKDESALFFVQNKCPIRESTKHAKVQALLEQLSTKK